MAEIITEALLEMHFHKALVELFAQTFGAKYVRLLKPSPPKEAWVGFDQGWVRTTLSTSDLLEELRQRIQLGGQFTGFFLGYFMQFKRVDKMTRRSTGCPTNYTAPYYRAELSLQPQKTTGLSQHETLQKLSQLKNADVVYACPMMFSLDDIYDEPDLDQLRIIEVNSSPNGWVTNQSHYITFQSPEDPNPQWLSEPVPAVRWSVPEWVHSADRALRRLSPTDLLELIEQAGELLPGEPMHESFTLIEFE